MLWRMIAKSMIRSRGQVALALVALVVVAALSATLLTITGEMGSQVNQASRISGPNLIVESASLRAAPGLAPDVQSATMPQTVAAQVAAGPWKARVAAQLYAAGAARGRPVVLMGADSVLQELTPSWKVEGAWPVGASSRRQALAGAALAARLGLHAGDTVDLAFSQGIHSVSVRISGILDTGGPEDDQLIVPLADLQAGAGLRDRISRVAVEVDGDVDAVAAAVAGITARIPGVQARSTIAPLLATRGLVRKVSALIWALTAFILLSAGLGVMTTLYFLILDRRKEMALLAALGATRRNIAAVIVGQAMVLGVVAGAAGWILGQGLAAWIGPRLLGFPLGVHWWAGPPTVAITIGVALLAAWLPVRQSTALAPAGVLKGE